MKNLLLGTVGSVIATSSPNAAVAADDLVDVYFGVGKELSWQRLWFVRSFVSYWN